MADSDIEWTDKVWNPTRGCSLVSEGCRNCYAMKQAHRFSSEGGPYEGLTRMRETGGPVWTGRVATVPDKLGEPLRWKKPAKVFVNSMSDLFHEDVTDEQIAAVFGVMAACPQHTFQVLTKRAERLPRWFEWIASRELIPHVVDCIDAALRLGIRIPVSEDMRQRIARNEWPLPNVHLGVSVEDQQRADRIAFLLLPEVRAAVKWASLEPLLSAVNLDRIPRTSSRGEVMEGVRSALREPPHSAWHRERLHWVVVGGESGPGARATCIEDIRSVVQQCRAAGTRVFVKQAGARVTWNGCSGPGEHWPADTRREDTGLGHFRVHLRDRKGGDLDELPPDLRVREMPRCP